MIIINKKKFNDEFMQKDKEIKEIIKIHKIIKKYLKEKEIPEEIINEIFIKSELNIFHRLFI